jgi:hypothetical protein
MRRTRFRRALIGAAALLLLAGNGAVPEMPAARYLGTTAWESEAAGFGSFSGLVVFDRGRRFVAIGDKGAVVEGRLTRGGDSRITGVAAAPLKRLLALGGAPLGRYQIDAEGLARGPDGAFYISFEAEHRIWRYQRPDGPAEALPAHPDFAGLQNNSGLEALAIDRAGALYTLPERSGRKTRPFPVYRYRNGEWDIAFRIPRHGEFLPVGADIGPDGRFYLLERHFNFFGFSTRVRRFEFTGAGLSGEETLIQTGTGRHDNLEGISVWRDAEGALRLTMISDDNNSPLQRTEFVEYQVAE